MIHQIIFALIVVVYLVALVIHTKKFIEEYKDYSRINTKKYCWDIGLQIEEGLINHQFLQLEFEKRENK